MKLQRIAGGALCCALLGAYAAEPYYGGDRHYTREASAEARVTSIEVVREGGRPSGGGAILGGIAGGVLGHQIGSGRGNDAATVAGAIGGAVVGNELEKKHRADERYRVTVRNRNGREESYVMDSVEGLRVGDRVRVDGGRIYPAG